MLLSVPVLLAPIFCVDIFVPDDLMFPLFYVLFRIADPDLRKVRLHLAAVCTNEPSIIQELPHNNIVPGMFLKLLLLMNK